MTNPQVKNITCVLIFFTILPVLGLHIEEKTFSSHDWPDAESIKILSGIRKAMAAHSRVLVRKSSF